MPSNPIDILVADLREIVAAHDDPRAILQKAAPLAGRLKDDKGLGKAGIL